MKTTIQVGNGHPPVECYGKWEEDSNAECLFEDEQLDGIWADGATNWTQAATIVARWAQEMNTQLIEMSAC